MTDSLVVSVRAPEAQVESEAYLSHVRARVEHAAALGARLIAWGAPVYAFELHADSIQDAIELALFVVRDAKPGDESAVGISAGSLLTLEQPPPMWTLSFGYPLVTSAALARAARPGEVLVDPALGAAKRGELLTVGSRVGVYGAARTRGLLVDVKHPWRTSLSEAGGVLRTPFVGSKELFAVDAPPGTVTVVRAGRGFGGTRLLEGIEQGLEPARTLAVTPHPFGEPLGALRRSMLRAVTMGHAPLNLSGQAGHSLDALLAGEGLDLESMADLLIAWLTPDSPSDPHGVVILDDASEVDADSLESIERALSVARTPFRVIARLGDMDDLPAALESLAEAAEVRLGPLSQDDAMSLAGMCIGGALERDIRTRWATRGGRVPLGVIECMREAIETGDLVWKDGRAVARLKSSGSGGARPPKHWVKRRLAHQSDDARRVLEAIAILGGQAELADLSSTLRRRSDLTLDLDATVAVLVAAGWVERLKPDVIALPGATHRDAILTTLEESQFHAWHRAASEAFAARDKPLAAAAATVHAALSGDDARARELSRLAAAATRAIGLERTAAAFEQYGERQDSGALLSRNLFTPQLEVARAMPSVWPGALQRSPSSNAPSRTDTEPPPSGVAPVDSASAGDAVAPLVAMPAPLLGVPLLDPPSKAPELGGAGAGGARAELQGLGGESGENLRRLRAAADEALRTGSRDRCRTALALGIAFAAANRHEEALLATLGALARAREMQDAKGERACVLFLAQLAATAGHHDVAEVWGAASGN